MAGEDHDGVKIDPKNVGGVEYNAVPEEKRQALEAHLKELEAEAKRRLVVCYGRLGKVRSRRNNSLCRHSHLRQQTM